ncbi:hypothetical protein [Glutamicibacter sp. NPDC087673]|uniref:hypothetical protein n=1 Tax=Glutamicibacter sp. NPDC087673 TaxID=3363997 RepID=UPI0037FB8A90
MPKSNQTNALDQLATEIKAQNTLLSGIVIKLDLALELLGDPTEDALGNDPTEDVPPLDLGD